MDGQIWATLGGGNGQIEGTSHTIRIFYALFGAHIERYEAGVEVPLATCSC